MPAAVQRTEWRAAGKSRLNGACAEASGDVSIVHSRCWVLTFRSLTSSSSMIRTKSLRKDFHSPPDIGRITTRETQHETRRVTIFGTEHRDRKSFDSFCLGQLRCPLIGHTVAQPCHNSHSGFRCLDLYELREVFISFTAQDFEPLRISGSHLFDVLAEVTLRNELRKDCLVHKWWMAVDETARSHERLDQAFRENKEPDAKGVEKHLCVKVPT